MACAAGWLTGEAGRGYVGVIVGGGLFLLIGGLLARRPTDVEWPDWGPKPLALGLPTDAGALVGLLAERTTPEARILWEDCSGQLDCGWTALLPQTLGRGLIGGLDADGVLEHAVIGMRDGNLAGRPLAAWTDAELDGYCRRYNVGWVVCRTPVARERFGRWPGAERIPPPDPAKDWHLYSLRRPFSYVLKGQAREYHASTEGVTLADVVPENGEVVLSLHYQAGWRVRPGWVRLEREADPYDPIPLVRLKAPGPVARITLTWERP
jgi:hypothetical protein